MPGGQLQLQSTLSITPFAGAPDSGSASVFEVDVNQTLSQKYFDEYQLTTNTPVAVTFGGLAQATFVRITVDASVIDIQLTHADGTNQVVPVDAGGIFELGCLSKPITAINLVGQPSQTINAQVFLGTI